MFVSFFPRPKLFLWSALAWTVLVMFAWYAGGAEFGGFIGLESPPADAPKIIGVTVFASKPFIWFYIYYALAIGLFYAFWRFYSPHPWVDWSILGSALIIFVTYFQVQISVAINNWYGPFWDLVQQALSKPNSTTPAQFYERILQFAGIALVSTAVYAMTKFFVSHWIFRWRTAMNDYYVANWPKLRVIEGASQRVQEDTMRFSQTMELLAVNFIDAVMTLIAFLPILLRLSGNVTELPILGEIPYPLVVVAIVWALIGTVGLALVGIKLPGLEFRNQRVEAAFRKELVYGEDNAQRAQPPTLSELFGNVRRNYFRLYFNYLYFNVARNLYLQTDIILPLVILVPTFVAGKITYGVLQQILGAFRQVRESFLYLVNAWPTIVDLLSVYKRLRAFESVLTGEPLPDIDLRYLEGKPGEV